MVKAMWWEIYQQFSVFIPGDRLLLFRLLTHKAKNLTLILVFWFPMLSLTLGAAVCCIPAARTCLECMRVIAHFAAGPAPTASDCKKREFAGFRSWELLQQVEVLKIRSKSVRSVWAENTPFQWQLLCTEFRRKSNGLRFDSLLKRHHEAFWRTTGLFRPSFEVEIFQVQFSSWPTASDPFWREGAKILKAGWND